jgi:hypothetical protein
MADMEIEIEDGSDIDPSQVVGSDDDDSDFDGDFFVPKGEAIRQTIYSDEVEV